MVIGNYRELFLFIVDCDRYFINICLYLYGYECVNIEEYFSYGVVGVSCC